MGRRLIKYQGKVRHIRIDPPVGFRATADQWHMTEEANHIINWLQYGATEAEQEEFHILLADHQTDRRTAVRLYYDAANYIRALAMEYDIAMTTVLHCAFEIAKRAGWFEDKEE